MIRELETLLILFFAVFLAGAIPAQGQNTINTYAGGGPDGAPALSATVPGPRGVAVDTAGNVYISSDFIATTPYSNRVFLVDRTGVLHVFAGTGDASFSGDGGPAKNAGFFCSPCGIALDAKGNLFIADSWDHRPGASSALRCFPISFRCSSNVQFGFFFELKK